MAADHYSGSEGDSQDSASTFEQRVLKVLSAIARGDANSGDIVAALRNEGVSSLDELTTVLIQAERERRDDPRSLPSRTNLQRRSTPTPPDRASSIVHPVPELPFVLNGTLYDPEDIQRFNGQELHFVPAASGDHILAVDDKDVMVKWWQLSQLSAIAEAAKRTPSPRHDVPPFHLHMAFFWEHMNFEGHALSLNPGYWYSDLTRVNLAGWFSDDWNDQISSVGLSEHGIKYVVLYEHINGEGSSVTLFNSEKYLAGIGWNDRASSIEAQ